MLRKKIQVDNTLQLSIKFLFALTLLALFGGLSTTGNTSAPEILWQQGFDLPYDIPGSQYAYSAVSHDGQIIATLSRTRFGYGSISLWNLHSGKLLQKIDYTFSILSMVFSEDDSILYAQGYFPERYYGVQGWRVSDKALVASYPASSNVNFLPDGQTQIQSVWQNPFVYQLRRNATPNQLLETQSIPDLLATNYQWNVNLKRVFSPDGKFMALAADRIIQPGITNQVLEIWNLREARLYWSLPHRSGMPYFSPDSQYLFIQDESKLDRFSLTDRKKLSSMLLSEATPTVQNVQVSSDGQLVAVAVISATPGELPYVNMDTFRMSDLVKISSNHFDELTSCWLTDNESVFAHMGAYSRLIRRSDGQILRKFLRPTVAGVFSPTEPTLAFADEQVLNLMDRESGELLQRLHPSVNTGNIYLVSSNSTTTLAFSGDGRVLAAGTFQNEYSLTGGPQAYQFKRFGVDFWNPHDGTLIRNLVHEAPIRAMAFSKDSHFLVTATGDYPVTYCPYRDDCSSDRYPAYKIRLWQVDNGKLIRMIGEPQNTSIRVVTISDDNSQIASGGVDGVVKLWNAADGQLLRTITGPPTLVRSLHFSSDGQLITEVYDNQTLQTFQSSDGQLVRSSSGSWLSPDGRFIAQIAGNKLNIHQASDNRLWATYDSEVSGIKDLAFSPDGTRISYLRADGQWAIAKLPETPLPVKGSGDVNKDGSINVLDAVTALQLIIKIKVPTADPAAADLDGSGGVNVSDVILILQRALGVPPASPPASDEFSLGLSTTWKTKQPSIPLTPSAGSGYGKLFLSSVDNDVWMSTWEPFYVYQDRIVGDFTMKVKVDDTGACNDLSAVGLMVTQSMPDTLVHPSDIPSWALIFASHAYGTYASWGGGGTSSTSLVAKPEPGVFPSVYWVRLDRKGSKVTTYWSVDGVMNWVSVASVDMNEKGYPLNDPITAGIVQQAHCGGTPTTASVSHFQAGPLEPSP